MNVAIIYCYGCSTIDYSLRRNIENESSRLEPKVEDSDQIERIARAIVANNEPSENDFPIAMDTTLEQYAIVALERSPSIKKVIRSIQKLGFRVEQVTSLQDPMLNVVPPTGNMTETAAGMLDASVGLSQEIPFPGKLMRRGKVAEQEVRMAFAELADLRIQLTSNIQRAYYDYSLASVSIAITNSSQGLLRQIREVAVARYKSGSATQQDVLRTEVEDLSLSNDLLAFQQQEASAKALLNSLLSRTVDLPLPPPKEMKLESIEWKLPQLLELAQKSNPKLVGLREQVQRDIEAVKVARLQYLPDFRLGFSYSVVGSGISPVENGDDNWSLPLGVSLPIWWSRIRAGINGSNAQVLSSIEQYHEIKNLIFFGLQDSLIKINTQYRQAALFRDQIIPRAHQAVEVSTANYQAGQIEFSSLVENWRNWLKFSLAYNRALAGLEQKFADLQQLVGMSAPRVAMMSKNSEEVSSLEVSDSHFEKRGVSNE